MIKTDLRVDSSGETSIWILRSPNPSSVSYVFGVDFDGDLTAVYGANRNAGVVPVLVFDLN